jgi:TatD DNase family protein
MIVVALASAAIDLGFYVSFSGILTFKAADELRAIAKDLPRDRVLVETDCPFLAPVPHRGKKNEPAFVALTAERLAELWDVSVTEVQAKTSENSARLFGLPPP